MQDLALGTTSLVGFFLQHMLHIAILGVCLQLLFCFAVQVVADKLGLPASWMGWVPILQLYPMVKAGGGSFTILAVWIASGLAAGLTAALLQGMGIAGIGMLVMLAWFLWGLVYIARILMNTAENRCLSGTTGLLCFIPLVGLFVYLYIAFHDGWVAPSKLGLVFGLLIYVVPAVPGIRAAGQYGELGTQMLALRHQVDDPEVFLSSLQEIGAQMDAMQVENAGAEGGEISHLLAEFTSSLSEQGNATVEEVRDPWLERAVDQGFDENSGFPVPDRFDCPAGTETHGAAPPAGFEQWCSVAEPGRTGIKHGWYAAWHRNGRLSEAGEYQNGVRDGVWTRWFPSGGKRTQAQFENDLQHGVLITWDELGRKEREIWYRDGEPRQP